MNMTIFRNVTIGYDDNNFVTFQVPILGMPAIPAGANPRSAKATSTAVVAMESGMVANDPHFLARNRGITSIARNWDITYNPDGTADIAVDYSNPGKATSVGHFDGGHTEMACRNHNQGPASTTCAVEVKIFNLGFFPSQGQIRSVAQSSNLITSQKAWSEADLRGSFDNLKRVWAALFPNASVEYFENEFSNPDYRVLEIMKLMFALLTSGESTALYTGTGRPPQHRPIAHATFSKDLVKAYERNSSFFDKLDIEIWAEFADYVRTDVDKRATGLRITETLSDGKKKANVFASTRLVLKTRSGKLTNSLFSGSRLAHNFLDMMWVFPIIHAFKQKFYRYHVSSNQMVWRDCEDMPMISPTKAAIKAELKHAWKQLRKPILQTMCNEFNAKWGNDMSAVNGFFPKSPELWSALAGVVMGAALSPTAGIVKKSSASRSRSTQQGATI